MEKRKSSRYILLVIVVVISLLGISVLLRYGVNYFAKLQQRKSAWSNLKETIVNKRNHFDGRSAIMIKEYNSGWEMRFNQDNQFASASLVKLPIMLVAFLGESRSEIDLKDTIKLSDSHKSPGSGVLKKMHPGKIFTFDEILRIMITLSDNTATNLMIDKLSMDYINDKFLSLGLENTNLSRKMMDFNKRKQGIENFTTAKDMSFVLDRLYLNFKRNDPIAKKCFKFLKQQKINDRIPARLPKQTPVAHKTGLERNICHDSGIVFTDKGDYLICVLTRTTRGSKYAKKYIADISLDVYNYLQENY
ncbi:MAG: serine hydrolase [Candidatus Gygaella obscura]|nr:serine hydrolase [Candidatus Gygaella obscura]